MVHHRQPGLATTSAYTNTAQVWSHIRDLYRDLSDVAGCLPAFHCLCILYAKSLAHACVSLCVLTQCIPKNCLELSTLKPVWGHSMATCTHQLVWYWDMHEIQIPFTTTTSCGQHCIHIVPNIAGQPVGWIGYCELAAVVFEKGASEIEIL